MTEGWRFFATRLNGDGTETPLISDLELSGARVTRQLNGAPVITGTISPEIRSLKVAGAPLLRPWSTCIYAENQRRIVTGGILQPGSVAQGPTLQIEAAGFTDYARNMPYDAEKYFVEVDAADIFRHIWAHIQSQERSNLGLVVDPTMSGVLIGEELEEVVFETGGGDMVAFEAGPFKLAWWATDDLGERLAELLDLGSFEFYEEHYYRGDDSEGIEHRIRLGAPRHGRRRTDLHFREGDNLMVEPPFVASDYASEVWVLGGGESRLMKIGRASRSGETRLRRVHVETDKSLPSNARCAKLAGTTLANMTGLPDIESITIDGSKGLPDLCDEVLVKLDNEGWYGTRKMWVRVLSIEQAPSTSYVTCGVERAK